MLIANSAKFTTDFTPLGTSDVSTVSMDYDQATAFLGHWGCFQKVVFFLLAITAIPNGTSIFCLPFITAVPHHYCHIPESNLSQDWLDAVIPVKVSVKSLGSYSGDSFV